MATYRAVANGNWSSLATWEDNSSGSFAASSVLPGVGDDVYANGFVVQVDQTISVKSLRNHNTTGIVVEGRFEASSSINITTIDGIVSGGVNKSSFLTTQSCLLINGICNIIINSSLSFIGTVNSFSFLSVISCISNANITINGSITGGNNSRGFFNEGSGIIIINGNVNGGATANYAYSWGFYNIGACTLFITGDITAGTGNGSNSWGFYNNGNCNATIVGNQFAYMTSSSGIENIYDGATFFIVGNQYASLITTQQANGIRTGKGIFNIIGNQYGNYFNSTGISITETKANVTITGNQIGGTYTSSPALLITAGNLTILGNQYAGASYAIYSTAPAIYITGNAYASATINAIYSSQLVIFTGNVVNNLSIQAIVTPKLFLNVTPTTVWKFSDFGGNSQYLYGAGVNTGHPVEADVRKDTVYGPNSEFEGTLAVPPASTVNIGVPVDNTVGTYALSGDLIARLEQCSTVAITGQQIASYLT